MNEQLVRLLNNLYEKGQFKSADDYALVAYITEKLLKELKTQKG